MKEFISQIPIEVTAFFICSLINVMLSTMKSILTVKASKEIATLINAISYGFNALVLKQLTQMDMGITVAITILSNIIGVYTSMWIMEKFKKDRLWKISITTKEGDKIRQELEEYDIPHTVQKAKSNFETYSIIDVYSADQATSTLVKKIVETKKSKYHVIELKNSL